MKITVNKDAVRPAPQHWEHMPKGKVLAHVAKDGFIFGYYMKINEKEGFNLAGGTVDYSVASSTVLWKEVLSAELVVTP